MHLYPVSCMHDPFFREHGKAPTRETLWKKVIILVRTRGWKAREGFTKLRKYITFPKKEAGKFY